MQSVQDTLTLAIEAIAITTFLFIAIDILDQTRFFGGYQIPAGWQPEVSATKTNLPVNIKTGVVSAPVPPVFVDPWLVEPETTELLSVQHESTQQLEAKPLLLLSPALVANQSSSLPSVQPKFNNLITGVDLDGLKLRSARKIAKTLGIAQKGNGKDLSLGYLKEQIKARLQNQNSIAADVLGIVNEILVS